MLRPRRLDGYVLRELAGPTFLGLLLYTFALLMNHFFIVAEKSLSKGLSLDLTLRMFLVGIPNVLVLALPMAVLLGTLIALGRLSADHEWVALQAAGRGPTFLLRPVLFHGLCGAAASFLIYAVVVPQTHYAFRNLRGRILFSSNLGADLKPRVFYEMPDESVLFVDEISPGRQRRLEGMLLIQPDPETKATTLVLARFGDLYPAPDGSGALIVDVYDGEARTYLSESPAGYRLSKFRRAEGHRIEPPRFIRSLLEPPEKVVQDLAFTELWTEFKEARRELRRLEGESATPNTRGTRIVAQRRAALATVEFHQRLALPAASLLFALLALPLGIVNVRSGKGAGFAMSLVVILVYRIVFVLARDQALNGPLPPALGPWVADAVILAWALVALRRLRRRSLMGAGRLQSLLARLTARLSRKTATARDREITAETAAAEIATLGGTPRRFVGRLDRYVGLTYLRLLGYAVAAAYLVYGLVELQGLMDGILRTGQPVSLVLAYFKYFAPTVLHVVLPIASLVAAVVAVTLLSRSGELVAIKASGVGMPRTTAPLLLLTLLLCGLLFLVEDRIAPTAQRKAHALRDQIEGRAPRSHGKPLNGRWSFSPDGSKLYHYRLYVPAKREFQGLSIFTLDRVAPRVVDHHFAEAARWTGDHWEVREGWHRGFDPDVYEEFGGEPRALLDDPGPLVSQEHRLTAVPGDDLPDQMSVGELATQIRTLADSGYDITSLRVAYHAKFSHAAAPLVMVLLGLPFAFRVGRRGSLYGTGVALLLVFVYWATFAIFNALGLETLLQPIVAAWGPNVMFGLLGIYLMLYIRT